MLRQHLTIASLLLALAGGYAYLILQIPTGRHVIGPGPTFMPWLLTLLLAILSIWLIVKTVRVWRSGAGQHEQGISFEQAKGLFTFAGLLVGYGLGMRYLGFELPTFLFLLVTSRLIGGGSLVSSAFWAAVLATGIWAIFNFIFLVPLPRAPWW